MKFLTVEFDKSFKKDNFDCRHDSLNNFLKLQATKETKSGLSRIYVLVNKLNEIIGYYSLSSSELPKECVPEEMLKKLPESYSGYSAILIGRLAITRSETSKGLGGELLIDAIYRCLIHAETIGTSVIIVDPIDKNATLFYEKYMFRRLPNSNRMILKIDGNLRSHFQIDQEL